MKKYLPYILISLASSVVSVGLYRILEVRTSGVSPSSLPLPANATASYPLTTSPDFNQLRTTGAFTRAAQRTTACVVYITTQKQIPHPGNLQIETEASGSGVILTENGLIATNNHVVQGSSEIRVSLPDKRVFAARLLGTDPSTDLALLQIDAQGLPAIPFGNSDSLQVGDWVLAVGNPFNLESTVTAGIVSAKGRSIDILETQDRIESFIQTDAVINPGNSGGALVNTNGELIGISTAIMTQSGAYEGYSFAVPSNLARKVIEDLRDYGMVQRGLLGVFIEPVTAEIAAAMKLPSVEGIRITRITPGSGADDAGLKPDDIILKVENSSTRSISEMQEQVGLHRPGNTLRIEYWRDGTRRSLRVQLKDKHNTTRIAKAIDNHLLQEMGIELRNLSYQEQSQLKYAGVRVLSVRKHSLIDATHLHPDFVITHINDKPVPSVSRFIDILKSLKGSRITLRGYYDEEREPYFYVFSMEIPAQ